MKISIDVIQKLSKIKNSAYDSIKIEYLYHSNKLTLQRSLKWFPAIFFVLKKFVWYNKKENERSWL